MPPLALPALALLALLGLAHAAALPHPLPNMPYLAGRQVGPAGLAGNYPSAGFNMTEFDDGSGVSGAGFWVFIAVFPALTIVAIVITFVSPEARSAEAAGWGEEGRRRERRWRGGRGGGGRRKEVAGEEGQKGEQEGRREENERGTGGGGSPQVIFKCKPAPPARPDKADKEAEAEADAEAEGDAAQNRDSDGGDEADAEAHPQSHIAVFLERDVASVPTLACGETFGKGGKCAAGFEEVRVERR